jgi:hypothetical protein
MPFAIERPTRPAKWLAGSTFLRAAQTAKASHAIAGISICRTTSSVLVNWRVPALGLSHPRKLRALASVPVTHSHSVKSRSLQTRSTSSREYCRPKMSLPVPSRTKSIGNLLADHALRDRRHVSARGMGCRKGALFTSSRSCQPIECRHRPSIFATTKMSMAPPRPPPKSK